MVFLAYSKIISFCLKSSNKKDHRCSVKFGVFCYRLSCQRNFGFARAFVGSHSMQLWLMDYKVQNVQIFIPVFSF